jgi:hypothetical protein
MAKWWIYGSISHGAGELKFSWFRLRWRPCPKRFSSGSSGLRLLIRNGRAAFTVRGDERDAAELSDACYFFSRNSIEARVISQSACMVQVLPPCVKEIVKSSSFDGNEEIFIGTRAKSKLSPG